MAQYNVGSPIERIAADILSPLPTSDTGNKYLLIVAGYFTKWTKAFPLISSGGHKGCRGHHKESGEPAGCSVVTTF